MTTADAKSFLLIFRHPPYGNSMAREALDVALASSAFVNRLDVLFLDDGTWQLLPGHAPESAGLADFSKALQALPVYGVEGLHMHLPSLAKRGIDPGSIALDCQGIDDDGVSRLIESHDVVLNF